MPKTNERRSGTLRTEADLKAIGFVEVAPGRWAKAPVGPVDTAVHSQPARTLDGQKQAKRRGPARGRSGNIRDRAPVLTVTMTAHLKTRMDGDNLANALKPVRDGLADWLGVDDADGRVRWECGQVETRGKIGVCVVLTGEGIP